MLRKTGSMLPISNKKPPKSFRDTKVGKAFTKLLGKKKWPN